MSHWDFFYLHIVGRQCQAHTPYHSYEIVACCTPVAQRHSPKLLTPVPEMHTGPNQVHDDQNSYYIWSNDSVPSLNIATHTLGWPTCHIASSDTSAGMHVCDLCKVYIVLQVFAVDRMMHDGHMKQCPIRCLMDAISSRQTKLNEGLYISIFNAFKSTGIQRQYLMTNDTNDFVDCMCHSWKPLKYHHVSYVIY